MLWGPKMDKPQACIQRGREASGDPLPKGILKKKPRRGQPVEKAEGSLTQQSS